MLSFVMVNSRVKGKMFQSARISGAEISDHLFKFKLDSYFKIDETAHMNEKLVFFMPFPT